eukprot:3307708-Karenia_brevis.AAC.1
MVKTKGKTGQLWKFQNHLMQQCLLRNSWPVIVSVDGRYGGRKYFTRTNIHPREPNVRSLNTYMLGL